MADDDIVLTTSAGDFARAPAIGSVPSRVSQSVRVTKDIPVTALHAAGHSLMGPFSIKDRTETRAHCCRCTGERTPGRRAMAMLKGGPSSRSCASRRTCASQRRTWSGVTAHPCRRHAPFLHPHCAWPHTGPTRNSAQATAMSMSWQAQMRIMHAVHAEGRVLLHHLQLPEVQPLLSDGGDHEVEDSSPEHRALQRRMRIAMVASLIVNVALLVSKIVAYALSQSKSVLASSADSFVDIASQACNIFCQHILYTALSVRLCVAGGIGLFLLLPSSPCKARIPCTAASHPEPGQAPVHLRARVQSLSVTLCAYLGAGGDSAGREVHAQRGSALPGGTHAPGDRGRRGLRGHHDHRHHRGHPVGAGQPVRGPRSWCGITWPKCEIMQYRSTTARA